MDKKKYTYTPKKQDWQPSKKRALTSIQDDHEGLLEQALPTVKGIDVQSLKASIRDDHEGLLMIGQ